MQTLAAGSKRLRPPPKGFTLLELLVVVALIAVATAGVSLSLRDSADSALDRDAERLASLLETGRAQARANGIPVVWRANSQGASQGFVFEGLPPPGLPRDWLTPTTRIAPDTAVTLGPEPLIEPRAVALSSLSLPERQVWVVTDGLRPFKVQNTPEWVRP
jgi:general secretion pathway protein H